MAESTIEIDVLCWGPAKDLTGVESLSLTMAPRTTLARLRDILSERYSDLAPVLSVIRMAVNESFVEDGYVLASGDVVALIPPVSGGAPSKAVWIDLVDRPISTDRVLAFVSGDPACGAIVTFVGTTRLETNLEHGQLVALRYEVYDAMAKKQLVRLAEEAMVSCGLGHVAIVHRIAAVPPAEVSVMIAVAAPHRSSAFDGCRLLIDRLKQDVPIWKQDVFADGFVKWVDPAKAISDSGT